MRRALCLLSILAAARAFAACSGDDGETDTAATADAGGEAADLGDDGGPADASEAAAVDGGLDAGAQSTTCRATGWCWENALPFGDRMYGVSGVAANDVWAVSNGSTILHFDGTT